MAEVQGYYQAVFVLEEMAALAGSGRLINYFYMFYHKKTAE